MEFLLLGGMILVMPLFKRIPTMKEASKALMGLQIPIGIIVLLVGLSLLMGPVYSGNRSILQGIMGVIAGATLITNLLVLIPKGKETVNQVSTTLSNLEIPIGIVTLISALTGMF